MTRSEAQQNYKAAMQRLEDARAAVKAAGLSDVANATILHNEMLAASDAVKVAARLRTKYAPAV